MYRSLSAPWVFLVLAAASFAFAGCGETESMQKRRSTAEPAADPPAPPAAGGAKHGAGNNAAAADPVPTPAPVQRHIFFTSTLDIVVKELDSALLEVEKLVSSHKGYVAKSEVKGDTGSRRTATFTLRVPAESFRALNDGLLALGVSERNAVDSQDVTDEYVDIEARLKNLKKEEDTLNRLLEKSLNREDEIKTRAEIRQIRSDIERIQGRLNYLSKLTALSTVALTLREIKDYKPPTAPTFGNRIGDTFGRSWEAVVDVTQGLVLVVVALVPWTPLWLPAVLGLVWWVRRLVRSVRENAARMQAELERRPQRSRAREPILAEEATAVEPVEPPRDDPTPPV